MVKEHDITKLPLWAQELIADLEERVKYWREEEEYQRHDAYDYCEHCGSSKTRDN